MFIENKFEIGQEVFLKTDKDQYPRIVISLQVKLGCLCYEVACGTSVSWHYEFELSSEVNVLTKIK